MMSRGVRIMVKSKRVWRWVLSAVLMLTLIVPMAISSSANVVFLRGISIPIEKVITNHVLPKEETFTFELRALNSAPMPDDSVNGVKQITITTKDMGKAEFGEMDVMWEGEYFYTVRELPGGNERIEYDDTIYDITLIVKWQNDVPFTDLEWTMYYYKRGNEEEGKSDSLRFENRYTPDPVVVDPPVEKKISGDRPAHASSFSFNMEADNVNFPMPEGSEDGKKSVTIQGEGAVDFGNITYTQAGVYTYKIHERQESLKGYTFDKTIYTMTVTVTDNKGTLEAERVINVLDGKKADKAVFTNQYKSPSDGKDPPKTGDDSNMTLYAVIAAVSAVGIAFLIYAKKNKKKEDNG